MTRSLFAAMVLLGFGTIAQAATPAMLKGALKDTPPPFSPHFMSQRAAQADMREGPSYAHKVLWVYRHKGYPFHVIAAFDIWRRVETADGTLGWMSVSMLTDARTVLVTGQGRAQLRADADPAAKVKGLADPGAILGLKACGPQACRVSAQGIDGWIARNRIWGVAANETPP